MRGRSVAAWSAASILVVAITNDPAYRLLVLAAAAIAVAAARPSSRSASRSSSRSSSRASWRPLMLGVAIAAASATLLNFGLSHLGADVLFSLPDGWPVVGGSYTLEALVFGAVTGVTLGAAILAAAPLTLLLEPDEVLDALPSWLARSGVVVSASLNLVPTLARSFAAVTEAQRLRGWRPGGVRAWGEVVVPVVLTAIEDSIQMAEAMEARAFGSGPRTTLGATTWTAADAVTAVSALGALALFAGARVLGQVPDWYPYPDLQAPGLAPLPAAACLLLFIGPALWHWRPSTA